MTANTEIPIEAYKALEKAKLRLMQHQDAAFFASVILSVAHEFTYKIPTAATNGIKILYNPNFFMELTSAERIGLMLHEVFHIIMSHMCRRGKRTPGRWNRAGDYAINLLIIDAKFKLPKGGLLDENYRGMSAEQIYELLDDEDDDDKFDDLIEGESDKSEALQEQIDEIIMAAAQAAEATDQAGSIPGVVQKELEKLRKPEIPWYKLIRAYFTRMAKVEYSFKRPNRRFFANGILMPGLSGYKMGSGAMLFDTSGSITDDMFIDFMSEMKSIIENHGPEVLHFIQWDTRIQSYDKLKNVKDIEDVTLNGGGGTCIKEGLEWLVANNPEFAIIFTDGYFSMPNIKPKCPVFWVIHSNPQWEAPYGRLVHYKFKDQRES